MKNKNVLNDPDEYPENESIPGFPEDNLYFYEGLINTLTKTPRNLIYEWRYKGGKSWLCKFLYKKRTILWLSILDGYFKIAFYSSAKTSEGIYNLEIDENIKSNF